MSLEEEPILVSVVAIEETSFVVDVVTPPVVPAVDVTVIDPAASIAVDVAGAGIDVTGIEVTSFIVDVAVPPALLAIDVTVGNPAAMIIVDIPGGSGDEVIGGKITIGPTPPASPGVNDVWIDTT